MGGNALPGESLRHVADIHYQFEIFKAGLLPKLEITEATAETLATSGNTRIVKVTATVTNTGPLPTQTRPGARALPGNREDAIWLIGDRDRVKFLQGSAWQSLGVIGGQHGDSREPVRRTPEPRGSADAHPPPRAPIPCSSRPPERPEGRRAQAAADREHPGGDLAGFPGGQRAPEDRADLPEGRHQSP